MRIQKRDNSDVATGMNYGVALLQVRVGRTLYVIPTRASQESQGPRKDYCLLSKVNHLEWAQTSWPAPIHPKGKPLGSHMVG